MKLKHTARLVGLKLVEYLALGFALSLFAAMVHEPTSIYQHAAAFFLALITSIYIWGEAIARYRRDPTNHDDDTWT